ncbi:MAG: HPr kinase/phosphatase C-terminal domain-containing protein [Alphaproteobacteria bacterium]|nr:HPr kinase/phosphatase C-terminal domain-containing protein [Alphaproteobacteria bacterium]
MKNIHATTVDINGNGILIVGPAGSGKSDLALRLIENKNAVLVSDDRTDIKIENGELFASPPKVIEGLLEVRAIGLIKKPFKPDTIIKLVVQAASQKDIERMPKCRFFEYENVKVETILLNLLEASAPDKVVVKLKAVLEQ